MWNIILIAAVAIVALLIVIVATRPADFRVTRSARIGAPADLVFANVACLRKWEAWSPWARKDPNAKSTFSGPESGAGASMHWAGNKQVGEGRMTITDSRPTELIRIRLEFLKPFKATHTAEFNFKSAGDQTEVTWSMFGKNNFMSKAFTMIMDCDKMIGADFEIGLASLNAASESALARS
jgi:hypothetical protein